MSRIHWLGAGLSSVPGIRRLANQRRPMTLWNRTLEKAKAALSGMDAAHVQVKEFDLAKLGVELRSGDVVVSMLPADKHPEVAGICLKCRSHLVTSSYISPAMRALDAEARRLGLSLINEVGLDPGLDHMLAHRLVAEFRESPASQDAKIRLSFRSFCGGFPKEPGPFCYKFSWSPIGVLRALKNPARYVRGGEERMAELPYRDLASFVINGESFESYPNRDSIPYLKEYRFGEWMVEEFVRGTFRPIGWASAWREVFAELEAMDLAMDQQCLENLSDRLWREYAYREGELDRVVLAVSLEARCEGKRAWLQSSVIDEVGSKKGSAMAQLVSLPVSLAVEWVLSGVAPTGISGPPHEKTTIASWLRILEADGSVTLKKDCSL